MGTNVAFARLRRALSLALLALAAPVHAEIVVKQAPPATEPAQDESAPEPTPAKPLNAAQRRKLAQLTVHADAGDVAAMLQLGWIYYHGDNNVARSYGEAYRRFRAAADHGNLNAMLATGYLLSRGLGTARDRNAARSLYAIAANAGYPRAWYLQSLLEGDLNTAQGTIASRQSLERAAAAGDALAANALGGVYERLGQRGTAQLWYRQAAAHGSEIATKNLQRMGDAPDTQAAELRIAQLRDRVDAGDAAATYELATRYHRGDGVAVNYGEALRLYRLAAGLGSAPAQKMMSLISSRSSSAEQINAGWMQELSRLAVVDEATDQAGQSVHLAVDEDPLTGLLDLTPQLPGGSGAAPPSGFGAAGVSVYAAGSVPVATPAPPSAAAPPPPVSNDSLLRARSLRNGAPRTGGQQ